MYSKVCQTSNNRHGCKIRNDDTGIWSTFKAWYIFVLHLLSCVGFVIMMLLWIDGHGFLTGSRSFSNSKNSTPYLHQNDLYQTEVNALVSLVLVLIRFIATAGSTLVTWRLIEVLLETCGLSLNELLGLVNRRIPITPRFESGRQFFWSLLAILVVTLSLPASLSAPLANSSLAWVPSERYTSSPRLADIRAIGRDPGPTRPDDAFGNFTLWPEDRWRPILQASVGATIDNGYAFTNDGVPLRRLFTVTNPIPVASSINLTVPFIDIKLKWIDGGPGDKRFRWLGNRDYITASGIKIDDTGIGGVFFYRDKVFNASSSRPKKATVFEGKKHILVRTARLFHDTSMPDGSLSDENTPCPSEDAQLGKLPNVRTADYPTYYNNGTRFDVRECFHVAEAEIRAGVRHMENCNLTYSSDTQHIATCYSKDSTVSLQSDLIINLSLDIMSEVIRNLRPLDTTSKYMKRGIDAYTTGMLRLAFHSAWSALTNDLGRATETISIMAPEPVVRASVARLRLYIWLGTNLALELCGGIMYLMIKWSGKKATTDPALAALTMDVRDVSHDARTAPGLCNAVSLGKGDRKLGRLGWGGRAQGDDEEEDLMECRCVRRVGFVDGGKESKEGMGGMRL
ncbi:hypothetical protein GQ43DRAFT_471506 [Delitschia confertaspora ATCC 74209]|uniref:Uncharacterized protein n=1 Tax=Delitschia confertaspora ATCC 74209 TaxID=1513339 RepID=A0A9P4JRC7_9PLEO|nr:hypothetical protein GQ43DRAFT_471506 [Delitschia confertaspora ATCC 74209]